MTPTPYQAAFLKEFFRMYSRYHLAKKLNITEKELSALLKHLGLRKKKDAKRTTLTDEQKQYVDDRFYKETHQKIADDLGVTVSTVRNYCFKNNLKKTGKDKYTPPPKEIVRYTLSAAPVVDRPKGLRNI
jgi:hypothetical protein